MREPTEADRLLIDTARKALFEITDAETVGAVVGLDESNEGVVDVMFASTMAGYPSWRWNVAVSIVDGREAPSVLEAELLPGEGALLAPDWVPWADRMADYRAAQVDDDDDSDDEDEDDDEDDDDDDDEESDEDETDLLDHDDEIDGVDFEANDEAADDDDDDDHDDESDDDEDDIDSELDDDDDEEPLTSNR